MATPKKTTIPAGVKKPTDRKPSTDTEVIPDAFSFEYNEKTYTLKETKSGLTQSWYRRNRNASEVDQMHSMVEALADDATLTVYDELIDGDEKVFEEVFADPFNTYMKAFFGVTPGESKAS